MANENQCVSCAGSGETPTDYGPVDCSDCGGAGFLPSRSVLVEWRTRDIERALIAGEPTAAPDVRWLISEVRLARDALTEVISLAHDSSDPDSIAGKIRFAANRALGLYDLARDEDAQRSAAHVATVTLPGRGERP